MNREEFIILYKKFLEGNCTTEERQLLESWKDEIQLRDEAWNAAMGEPSAVYRDIRDRLQRSIVELKPTGKTARIISFKRIAAVAASILLLAALALYIKYATQRNTLTRESAMAKPGNNNLQIHPGGNKAYLTLSNGSQIVLNDAGTGKLASESGVRLSKNREGLVVYTFSDSPGQTTPGETVAYNTIITPRGGQYQVVLADGTAVWINAASTLRFPVSFTGGERKVELTGEGYFEVAKDASKPFRVVANGSTVEVLGTHFNISAYTDDEDIVTTLVEGSVKMSKGSQQALLQPGQQAIAVEGTTGITVKKADIEQALAWKNGYFIFHEENIVSIMKKVSRWYDVDISYQGDVQSTEFGGTISRYKNITDLLDIISMTGTIHYKLEKGRVIMIK